MAKLGQVLVRLDKHRLPVHITPVARQMIEAMAAHLTPPIQLIFNQLLDPDVTDNALEKLGQEGGHEPVPNAQSGQPVSF